MNLIKIAIGNTNPTVGAFRSNTDQLIAQGHEMEREKATIGVFGEMAISGYPPEDLVNWKPFVTEQLEELRRFASETSSVGNFSKRTLYFVGLAVLFESQVYNCVAAVHDGKILGIVPKEDNPTYNVFYELRKFARGYAGLKGFVEGIPFGDLMYETSFGKISSGVCESVWQADGPMMRHAYYGSILDAYVNASPWRVGVRDTRKEMLATRSSDNLLIAAYANLVGAQDSLAFDGGGHVYSLGRSLLDLSQRDYWREGIHYAIADVDEVVAARVNNTTWRLRCEEYNRKNPPAYTLIKAHTHWVREEDARDFAKEMRLPKNFFIPEMPTGNPVEELMEDLEQATIAGIAGYMEKTKRLDGSQVFQKIGIGNSGGRDSILVLCLLGIYLARRGREMGLSQDEIEKLISETLYCFSFPTQFNSEETKNLSKLSSETIGATWMEIPISDAYISIYNTMALMHHGNADSISRIARQNLQSRIRAMLLMTWANSTNAFILQTGVMSEEATGYSTMLGDHNCGFFAPIKNLPKTLVNTLLAHMGRKYHWGFIDDLLKSTASAELEADQADEKDLMPYAILDDCIHLFAGRFMMPDEMYVVLRGKWSDEELKKLAPHYEKGMLKAWVKTFVIRFFGSIFKWVQAPLGVHLGNLDLDRERALQLPVVQSLEWLEDSFKKMDRAED